MSYSKYQSPKKVLFVIGKIGTSYQPKLQLVGKLVHYQGRKDPTTGK